MTPERWQQIKQLFNSALEREQSQRSAFLADACSGDEYLRSEVESLLSSHERDGRFIDAPAFEYAADLLSDPQSTMAAGQTLGSFRILSTLGRGGMGEVYLAEDTRLGRKVALKFLPPSLAGDQDRLRRFEGEARAASALNHPNILTIYEIGSGGGRQFIAAEYVEGETLRQRMVHTRLSVLEALDIALQVASALVAAHHAKIVHRDIKPENIMMRHDGYVKVVDFGLAKLTAAPPVAADTSKPTLLQIDTDTGMVMGTTAYMSPEQARGLTVDARSDIWSLGVVMYEMVAARPPFEGDTRSDVLVAILERQPVSLLDISAEVPESFEWIVAKALTKEPEERYQTAREILSDLRRLKQKLDLIAAQKHSSPRPRVETGEYVDDSAHRSTTLPGAATDETNPIRETLPHFAISRLSHNRLILVLAASIVLALVIGVVWSIKRFGRTDTGNESKTSSQVLRATQITFSPGLDGFPSLSPDAKSVVYSSDQNGGFEIYIRQLTPGGGELQLTNDGQQNVQPSWSPDGQRIAYYSKNRGGIWVISALGGAVKQLTEAGSRPAWSPDGSTIAFQSGASGEIFVSRAMPPSTIWIVLSQGGGPRQITRPGNPSGGHASPSWSPDGKRLAFEDSDYIFSSIWSVAIAGGEPRKITEGNNPIYAPDGKHIYYQGAADPGLSKLQLATSGEPIGEPVNVMGPGPGTALRNPAISADGKKLVYSATRTSSNLWSVSLSPASADALGPPSPFSRDTSLRNNLARFSPDGRKLALTRWRPGTSADIWVADVDGRNLIQVTSNSATDSQASWFPQSDRLAFLSDRDKPMKLWTISLATGKEEPFLDLGEGVQFAQLSPDAKQVAFNLIQNGAMNVWVASVKDGQRTQLTFDSELMGFPCWSPDGQFLAFEMQRGEDAYLMVMPSNGGQPTQLTFDHAKSWPHDWSPDGDKIVFSGQRDGIWNIYWISRTTKAQKQLTNYSKLNAFVRYPAWSPLGNQIVYEYAETTGNIWLMELK
jgi:Tol biopolymer transport system component